MVTNGVFLPLGAIAGAEGITNIYNKVTETGGYKDISLQDIQNVIAGAGSYRALRNMTNNYSLKKVLTQDAPESVSTRGSRKIYFEDKATENKQVNLELETNARTKKDIKVAL
jgi:hypothetical protein